MLQIKSKANTLILTIPRTSLGKVEVSVDFIEIGAGMEYLFTAQNLSGKRVQWVTDSLSLLGLEQAIIDRLELDHPTVIPDPEENPEEFPENPEGA